MDVKPKTDEFGIMISSEMMQDREMTRERWLEECFPPWGTYVNDQIENDKVPKGKVALWWFGGPSWALRHGEESFLIDNYAGPSTVSIYDNCGVCRSTGADRLHWFRINPQVIDPWKLTKITASFSTHHHSDHCDIYTVKALLKNSEAMFVGPKVTCGLFRKWGVPEKRIKEVKPGDTVKFRDVEVKVEQSFDAIASNTTAGLQGGVSNSMGDVAVTYIFKTSGGSVAFLGDAIYHNGFAAVGKRNDIDIVITDMGHNAPGGTDKMSPFDVFRVAQALRAKVVIPDHYENWASSAIEPDQLEYIVRQNDPSIKTVILKAGAKFVYPDDENIGRYRYPDWRERYNPEKSTQYGSATWEKA